MTDIVITIAVVGFIIAAARLVINAANKIHVSDFERQIIAERQRAVRQERLQRQLDVAHDGRAWAHSTVRSWSPGE